MKHLFDVFRTTPSPWPSLLGVFCLAGLIAGCGVTNPHPPGSFERGVFYADNGKNVEAVAAFESFVRRSPTDSLAARAQFLKAMTYMDLEEYPLAAVEFQIMRKDYPTSDLVENARYQEGVAYLRQVGRIERDITGAYEARLHFLRFSETHPDSEFMPQIMEHMQEISDLMVAKRLQQVKVFGQLRRYSAMALVLDDVLLEEAGSGLLDKVLWERARVAEKLDRPEIAAGYYQRLASEYPESPLAGKARSKLGALPTAIDPAATP